MPQVNCSFITIFRLININSILSTVMYNNKPSKNAYSLAFLLVAIQSFVYRCSFYICVCSGIHNVSHFKHIPTPSSNIVLVYPMLFAAYLFIIEYGLCKKINWRMLYLFYICHAPHFPHTHPFAILILSFQLQPKS